MAHKNDVNIKLFSILSPNSNILPSKQMAHSTDFQHYCRPKIAINTHARLLFVLLNEVNTFLSSIYPISLHFTTQTVVFIIDP